MTSNGDIDRPGLKERLWHDMRADLARYMPRILETELLMCPACCRFLPFKDFDVEHIIPKQAVKRDPEEVRSSIPKDQRSGTILLCKKTLKVNGIKVHGLGCNSWKGKHYDYFIADILRKGKISEDSQIYGEHTTAMFAVGFLALVQIYGFQPALMPSGLIMRKQFFNPHGFIDDVPWNCQMLLMASDYTPSVEDIDYWQQPFRFTLQGGACTFCVRNVSIRLPVSRDPTIPVANYVRFAPKRYTFAPNFYTIFE